MPASSTAGRDGKLLVAGLIGGGTCMAIGFGLGLDWRPRPPDAPPPAPVSTSAPTPPTPAPPAPVAAVDPSTGPRDLGGTPLRIDAISVWPWRDRPGWAMRVDLRVSRLRELPAGTALRSKLTCLVSGQPVGDDHNVGMPEGPVALGESGGTFVDHFYWGAPLTTVPHRCELLLYAQMPGARGDTIDHELTRRCVQVVGDGVELTDQACPPLAEAP